MQLNRGSAYFKFGRQLYYSCSTSLYFCSDYSYTDNYSLYDIIWHRHNYISSTLLQNVIVKNCCIYIVKSRYILLVCQIDCTLNRRHQLTKSMATLRATTQLFILGFSAANSPREPAFAPGSFVWLQISMGMENRGRQLLAVDNCWQLPAIAIQGFHASSESWVYVASKAHQKFRWDSEAQISD